MQISFLVAESGCVAQPRLEVASQLPTCEKAVLAALHELSRPWVLGLRDG